MVTTPELVAGAAGCVAAGAALGRLLGPRRRPPQAPAAVTARPARYGGDPDIGSVRVGDRVALEGTRGRVVATIGYLGSDADRWSSVCVDLGGRREWVTLVDEETQLEVCRWTKLDFLPGQAGAKEIRYGPHTFVKRETGTADYDAHGDVDLPTAGAVRFVDYADGPNRLSFEDYDDAGWEASLGRVVVPGTFVLQS